ncbi:MAG: C40 family peptidase [Proteobacteria bacterium]|nr:C40 family peptidase [Pseudomonadota bacterium]
MKSACLCLSLLLALSFSPATAGQQEPVKPSTETFGNDLRLKIEQFLGRPYARGTRGPKRFDCSGFVWRVMRENGIRMKRTSARKLYFSLPKIQEDEKWQLGSVVFFNNMKHCGIVNDESSFYHASSTAGTTLSEFAPYWRERISGFRRLPIKKET